MPLSKKSAKKPVYMLEKNFTRKPWAQNEQNGIKMIP